MWAEYRVDSVHREMYAHARSHPCTFDKGCAMWDQLCAVHDRAYDRLAEVT